MKGSAQSRPQAGPTTEQDEFLRDEFSAYLGLVLSEIATPFLARLEESAKSVDQLQELVSDQASALDAAAADQIGRVAEALETRLESSSEMFDQLRQRIEGDVTDLGRFSAEQFRLVANGFEARIAEIIQQLTQLQQHVADQAIEISTSAAERIRRASDRFESTSEGFDRLVRERLDGLRDKFDLVHEQLRDRASDSRKEASAAAADRMRTAERLEDLSLRLEKLLQASSSGIGQLSRIEDQLPRLAQEQTGTLSSGIDALKQELSESLRLGNALSGDTAAKVGELGIELPRLVKVLQSSLRDAASLQLAAINDSQKQISDRTDRLDVLLREQRKVNGIVLETLERIGDGINQHTLEAREYTDRKFRILVAIGGATLLLGAVQLLILVLAGR